MTLTSVFASAGRAGAVTFDGSPGAFDSLLAGSGALQQPASAAATGAEVIPAGDANGFNVVFTGWNGNTSSPTSTLYEYTPTGGLVLQIGLLQQGLTAFEAQAVAVAGPGTTGAGDIVVAGWGSSSGCSHAGTIEGFNPSGNLLFERQVDCAETSQFQGVAVDAVGDPVAAGFAVSTGPEMLIGRFSPSGVPDGSFGSGGLVETNLGASDSQANAVAVTGSGAGSNIYVTGSAAVAAPAGSGTSDIFLADFTGTGAANSSFAGGGLTDTGLPGFGSSVILLNGDPVVAGETQNSSGTSDALIQWNSAGALDTNFGAGNGEVIASPNLNNGSGWNAVTYDPNGNFLDAVGFAGSSMAVSQYLANTGALNPRFGSGGTTVRSFPSPQRGFLVGVGVEPDGSTVAAGTFPSGSGNNTSATLIRLDGPFIALTAPPVLQVTSSGPTTVVFTATLDEQLSVPSIAVLCTNTPGATIASQGVCATITIPAGQTSIQVPVVLDVTSPVGQQQTVAIGVQSSNGLGGDPQTGFSVATVQHLPPPPRFKGYWMVAADGGVFNFGNTRFHGSTGAMILSKPMVGMAVKPDGSGYWLVASDGGIFAFGVGFYGSTGSIRLNKPIVGMAATPDGKGYWLVATDGGIFAFGDARFYGSTGNRHLNRPIVGISATPDGKGYWLVASDGGIFSFGDARFDGSAGGIHLSKAIVGMAAFPGASGYWLVASDGGIFSFGAAKFHGSTGAITLTKPVVGMAATPDGKGYWLVASDGGIFSFGDAKFYGSTGAIHLVKPIVGMAE